MKFAQMATKKLQKLVNDPATSDEDKVAIQAILDKRQAAAQAPADDGAALSPEEQAAIDAAEKEAAKQMGVTLYALEGMLKRARKWMIKRYKDEYDRLHNT